MHPYRPLMRSSNGMRHRLALWLVSLVASLGGFTAPAGAQGTMGTVPDPISARELSRYADRLGLSPQQRQALESIHDQYKEEFAHLRDTDIEKFLASNRGGGGGGLGGFGGMGMLNNRAAVVKGIKDLDDILDKIKAVDNRFFDQMQTMLADQQIERLQQVRQMRERVRYRSGLSRLTSFLNPAAQVDLSELLAGVDLSPQETQATDPLLMQYESSLTAAAHKLHDATQNMMLDALDKLQAQGFTEDAMRDPERRGEMFQAFRILFGEIQRKLAEKAGDLSELNRKTIHSLTPVLSEEHARRLREDYLQRAYQDIGRASNTAARAFDIALKFQELTEEQLKAVTDMAVEFRASLDRLMDQAVELIDENRKTQTLFDFDAEKRRKYEEDLSSVRDRRAKLNETSGNSLRATLGPDLTARLEKRLGEAASAKGQEESFTITMTGGLGGAGFTAVSVAQVAIADGSGGDQPLTDPYVPGPISKRDVDAYAVRLDLSPEDKAILNTLHDDYSEKFREVESAQIKAVREAERNLWAASGSGAVTPPTTAAVDQLYDLRRLAVTAVTALDSTFFADAETAVGNDARAGKFQRLRSARLREVYNRGGGGGGLGMFMGGGRGPGGGPGRDRQFRINAGPAGLGGPGGRAFRFTTGSQSDLAGIDLSALVDGLKLKPADPAPFDAALLEYETTVTAAFQKAYETNMRMQLARDKMVAEASRNNDGGGDRGGGGGGRGGPGGDGFRSMMDNEGKAAREARQAVLDLNKATLTRLMAALSETDAQQLRQAYNRKAFPDVFSDSRSAEPQLNSALKLPDLTDQQRAQVQQIAAEFHGQYDQVCEKLIELESAATSPAGGSPQNRDWQAMQEQMRTREKLDFERNDLSDKTLGKLRAVLNEQQIQQLGGLQPQAAPAG